jgi:dihydrodipicolinate synthase/N-acetylneuraminate lyase
MSDNPNDYPMPPHWVREALLSGMVIPAHPLALDGERKLDEKHQRALTRYYHAAGAGGLAVGVHSTQFEIRDRGLYEPVLNLAYETAKACDAGAGRKTVMIAGVIGRTPQAVSEARTARGIGYDAGMLSLGALQKAGDDELIDHCRLVAREIPLVGFYLQPAAGGRILPLSFWRRLVRIPNLIAIKIAPFNRYQTIDVIRAVAESGRAEELALLTGNDDHILLDLLAEYRFKPSFGAVRGEVRGELRLGIVGGLLGQWACWTKRAVEMLETAKSARESGSIPAELLILANQLTDANAALFDAANDYAGCISGIHEVLRRQGLMSNNYCLDASACLSPGQVEEIDRVIRDYPHLTDDAFVEENLAAWLD